MTGSNDERWLVRLLEDEYGYACLRAPSSGSGTKRDRPDVVALRCRENGPDWQHGPTARYAIEAKGRPDGVCSFSAEEIEALNRWAKTAGVHPVVVVKPDLRSFDQCFVQHTEKLHETENGNYSIRQEDWDKCKSIPEVFG